jgi:DNA-binding response OmpR family regulator
MDEVPVLMLTAHCDVPERVRSLDAGADDFLAKPFAVAELRARVRALGRRRDKRFATPRIVLRDASLDFAARRAQRQGKPVLLTAREWTILEALAEQVGHVVPRATLLHEGWGAVSSAAGASLEVLIGRIRRKLGEQIIETVRGTGYRLVLLAGGRAPDAKP